MMIRFTLTRTGTTAWCAPGLSMASRSVMTCSTRIAPARAAPRASACLNIKNHINIDSTREWADSSLSQTASASSSARRWNSTTTTKEPSLNVTDKAKQVTFQFLLQYILFTIVKYRFHDLTTSGDFMNARRNGRTFDCSCRV